MFHYHIPFQFPPPRLSTKDLTLALCVHEPLPPIILLERRHISSKHPSHEPIHWDNHLVPHRHTHRQIRTPPEYPCQCTRLLGLLVDLCHVHHGLPVADIGHRAQVLERKGSGDIRERFLGLFGQFVEGLAEVDCLLVCYLCCLWQ